MSGRGVFRGRKTEGEICMGWSTEELGLWRLPSRHMVTLSMVWLAGCVLRLQVQPGLHGRCWSLCAIESGAQSS